NSIMVTGNAIGEVMFYGRGAGKYPTASAVVADVIDAAKHISARKFLSWDDAGAEVVADIGSFVTASYIRVSGESARSAVITAFGEVRFLERDGALNNECAFITPEMSQKKLGESLEKLDGKVNILSNMMVLS
ncbi:MAG: homoserine dehydrogenase, partial [Oscillospiraceae bacterium]